MQPSKFLACALAATLLILFHPLDRAAAADAVTDDGTAPTAVPSASRDAGKADPQAARAGGAERPESAEDAQEEEEAEPDPAADVLLQVEKTRTAIDAVLAIEPEIEAATGEQRAVLVEQQRIKRKEASKLFAALIDEIVELRKQGIDDRGARDDATKFLERVVQWAEQRMRNTHAEIEKLRTARESASAEELPKIEEQLSAANAEYDKMLNGWLRLCEAREALDLDATEQYARLDELLTARSETRAGQVRVTQKRIADYTSKVASADEVEAKRLQEEISRLKDRIDGRTKSLRRLVDLMDERGLPTAEYRQLLISSTGEITTDIFKREVAIGLIQQWFDGTRQWLVASGPSVLFKALLTAAILFAFHIIGRISQRIVRRGLQTSNISLSKLLREFLLATAYRLIVGIGILIALSQLGVQIGPLLAGLGVAGFIVGFALQDTLSNFASGMMILAYRPFDVGDVVNAGGVAGKVYEMTLVTTTILTFDNQRLIVPNTKIWGDVITNVTAERVRRVDLTFGIGYADDIEHVEKVLREIVEAHEKVLEDPEPTIKLHELGDSSVNFVVRPWAKTVDYWDVYWDITREVKRRFDAEGISIPFPQRDVHFYPRGSSGGSNPSA